ncbi:MAG: hypothetical protein M1816_003707 [Peltula sp. TS41687]|nr:MAG: hypothetical protein M1816_003707 [Peltula sp. TS41687]
MQIQPRWVNMASYETLQAHERKNPEERRKEAESEIAIKNWRYLLGRSSGSSMFARPSIRKLSGIELSSFFETASHLVSTGESGIRHEIVTSLSSEEGLHRVEELTSVSLDTLPAEVKISAFRRLFLPFLTVITDKYVLSSLLLENSVGTIYNFLFGSNGSRAIRVFRSLGAILVAIDDDAALREELLPRSLSSVLSALTEVIDRNQTAYITVGLQDVASTMATWMVEGDINNVGDIRIQAAYRSLQRIKARLGLGAAMPSWQPELNDRPQITTSFQLEQGLPGIIAGGGPRHDNDHADISRIRILPTADEINSNFLEYLPVNDPQKLHKQGIQGLLDRHFRLLREDTVGQLRDSVRAVTEKLCNPGTTHLSHSLRSQNGTRMFVHLGVLLVDITFDKYKGLQVTAEFDQPSIISKKTPKQRQDWWEDTRQLMMDSLVCLIDARGRTVFLSVSDEREQKKLKKAHQEHDTKTGAVEEVSSQPTETVSLFEEEDAYSLWNNSKRAAISLCLVETTEPDINHILDMFQDSHSVLQALVEFPGVLLPSFRPTLQALQAISRRGEVPFSEVIAPDDVQLRDRVDEMQPVRPPLYALQRGFEYDLSPVTNGECNALVTALTNGLALIQGPPGTGKSFVALHLVKVLLRNRDRAEMGPIICVCYTNHALDQFLEHLVRDGADQLIRIGSRSKSVILEPLKLRAVSAQMERTKIEKRSNWAFENQLGKDAREIADLLMQLTRSESWSTIKYYLLKRHSFHHDELFGAEEEGWTRVINNKEKVIERWLQDGFRGRRAEELSIDVLQEQSLLGLSHRERARLHKSWIAEIQKEAREKLMVAIESYSVTKRNLDRCRQELDLRCLQQAKLIGVTTSGLAKNIDLLRRLRAKTLICEEAGEVLEAHMLTALLPSIEHAILIGDHQQLRPRYQNYELSVENPRGAKYSFDVSLFERLVQPDRPGPEVAFSTLQTQRRMHPSISQLIRDTIYPNLKDDDLMQDYPSVAGVRKRLYWLDHREHETKADESQPNHVSHSNDYEVELAAALVSHLTRQGTHRASDIVVLTPYVRQLQKIRRRLNDAFEILIEDRDLEELENQGDSDRNAIGLPTGPRKTALSKQLRVATVDNFQSLLQFCLVTGGVMKL